MHKLFFKLWVSLKFIYSFDFQPLAKLDPMRPSRKFSQLKAEDEAANDEMKDKQAKRAQRLQALAEETFDDDAWSKRKSDFASKLHDDEYVLFIKNHIYNLYLIGFSILQSLENNADQSKAKNQKNKSKLRKKKLID